MRRLHVGIVVVLCLLSVGLPKAVSAQSAIAGLVTDSSGAVLPGVTVEAASPVLIEGRRVAVTSTDGRYTIIDLRPGTYSVVFSLAGFGTLRREGLVLPADFTAAVNAQLSVGAIEENVTVSGASPVVDVQNAQRTQVVTREILDALPTARSLWSIGGMVPGISQTSPDVGGSRMALTTYSVGHGASERHTTAEVDGMLVNGMLSDGREQGYVNEAGIQEVTYQTSGISADVSAGGIRVNVIPRDGGNTFAGSAWLSGTSGAWVADNVTPALHAQGLVIGSHVTNVHDLNPSLGGPLKRNTLWFFAAATYKGVSELVSNTFFHNGQQGGDTISQNGGLVRLTWQATAKNKISASYDGIWKYYSANGLVSGVDPQTSTSVVPASTAPYYLGLIKWTSTVSNRLLIEAGHATNAFNSVGLYQPGIGQATPRDLRTCPATPCYWDSGYNQSGPWYQGAGHQDLVLGTLTNGLAGGVSASHPIRYTESGSMSYLAGSHALKTGIQWSHGTLGVVGGEANANLTQQYRNRVPVSVLINNLPVNSVGRVDADLAAYAQDSWTVHRLTANLGVRFEYFKSSIDAEYAPASRFVAARQFSAVTNLPTWFDVAPRLGTSYDLFGRGKTALKFTVGRYELPWGAGFANTYNPMVSATDTRTWTDMDLLGRNLPTNGDGIAQDSEIGPSTNPAFGIRSSRNPDPNIQREHNIAWSGGVQQEMWPGASLNVMWYHRAYYNLATSNNTAISLADYTPVTVFSPVDGTPITAYNLSATKRGLVNIIDTTSTNHDLRNSTFTGFEVSTTIRLPKGANVFGGWTIERTLNKGCEGSGVLNNAYAALIAGTSISPVTDPNSFRFCNQAGGLDGAPGLGFPGSGLEINIPFQNQFKLAGNYVLPGGLMGAVNFASLPAPPGGIPGLGVGIQPENQITWLITPSTRYAAGCLGACTPGALVIPNMTNPSLTIRLTPPGTLYLPRWTQLDASLSRRFAFGRLKIDPKVDVFNVLNSNGIFLENTSVGPALGTPLSILPGRLLRLGATLKW